MMEFIVHYFPRYLQGALIGIFLASASMAFGLVLGTLIAIARVSDNRILRILAQGYAALFRGLPPLVMLYIVYFGLPTWAYSTGDPTIIAIFSPIDNRLFAAIFAFTLTAAAYNSEIVRSAILSISTEQHEAAKSIGMTYMQSMRRIILPQAMRTALPPLGNEFIILLKGTSLASVLGVTELMRTAQMVAADTFQNLAAYTYAGIFYLVMVLVLQLALGLIERRLEKGRS